CLLRVRRNPMAMRSTNSSAGAARNHDWPSTGPLCSGIASSWNRTTSLPPRSTCAWPPFAGIRRVKGAKRLGVRIGNWQTVEQSKILLQGLPAETVRGKRDRAILALLNGCGLPASRTSRAQKARLQIREEHWVVADLIGKGKHIRTKPVPAWA